MPQLARQCELRGVCFKQRREDDFFALVQINISVLYARHFFAANRVRRHKAGQPLTQCFAGRQHHILFGRAHVHHQCVAVNDTCNGLQRNPGGGHRHGQQHQVGTACGVGRRAGHSVNHAHLQGQCSGGRRGAEAANVLNQAGALECQRK